MLCMSVTIFHGKFWMAFDYIRNINVFIVLLQRPCSRFLCCLHMQGYFDMGSFWFTKGLYKILPCNIHSTKCIRNEVVGVFCQIPPWLFIGCLGTQVHCFLVKQMSCLSPRNEPSAFCGRRAGIPITLPPHWANHGVLLQRGWDGHAGGHSCPCNHPVCMDRTTKESLKLSQGSKEFWNSPRDVPTNSLVLLVTCHKRLCRYGECQPLPRSASITQTEAFCSAKLPASIRACVCWTLINAAFCCSLAC